MERESPDGMDITFEEDSNGFLRVVPNPKEQLPLDVVSNDRGCFIYDANGAEVGYWDETDWAEDPKLLVWMVKQMCNAYEHPEQELADAAQHEPMTLFYDREYPNDDVVWKERAVAFFGPSRELPPLDGRDAIVPSETPLDIELDDNYSDDQPSVVRIRDGGTVLEEWVIERGEAEVPNQRLGAEVAWTVRLAYERPWVLQT
ncbi:hypothetical protein [Halobacterium zhouii]|uniref:hypothetical protein n=1 Tax=Halobacterium zhouii TaxID=2902624 RepID=UPI001E330C19|nr:hypothetical protein [Halobacterium zhouii]